MLTLFYGNNTEPHVYLTIIKQKRSHAAKHKAPIHKTISDANIPLARLYW
jgi:hypothetical protein